MIYTIFPCPISFSPWIHFAPHIILPPYYFAPPPGNCLMIYSTSIYPCPIFPHPWIHFAPISFCPRTILPPGNCLMINTIYTIYPCPISFFPLDSFSPRIILPPWKDIVQWFTHVPYHFASWIHFCPLYKKKAYNRRASGDCGTSGVYTLLHVLIILREEEMHCCRFLTTCATDNSRTFCLRNEILGRLIVLDE